MTDSLKAFGAVALSFLAGAGLMAIFWLVAQDGQQAREQQRILTKESNVMQRVEENGKAVTDLKQKIALMESRLGAVEVHEFFRGGNQ